MKAPAFMVGVVASTIAFIGLTIAPATAYAGAVTIIDSCEVPAGGGWAPCQSTRCDWESNTCMVTHTWWQWFPEVQVFQ